MLVNCSGFGIFLLYFFFPPPPLHKGSPAGVGADLTRLVARDANRWSNLMPHFYLLVPRHEEDDLKGIALYKKCGFLIFTCALHGLPARKKVSLHFNCLEIFIIICTNLHNSGPSLSRRKKKFGVPLLDLAGPLLGGQG